MQLTKNFHLSELTRSQVAARYGINNRPNAKQTKNLLKVCEHILQPVRDNFKKPVVVSSGYRSPQVNARIGSNGTSQHCLGQAADFEIPGVSNEEVARWIKQNLDYDQLILEYWDGKTPNSGWIHCSYVSTNRQQAMVYDGRGYINWSEIKVNTAA